jgi:hypothetical protein
MQNGIASAWCTTLLVIFPYRYAPHYITDEAVSVEWLYNLSVNLWSNWLPPETRETILHGGYYTALAKPGFRIIGLNNNVCYTQNW